MDGRNAPGRVSLYLGLMALTVTHLVSADCPRPPEPHNGYILIGNYQDENSNNYPEGTVAWYQCEHDHVINGSAFRICEDKGTWTGPDVTCNLAGSKEELDKMDKAVQRMTQYITYLLPMMDFRRFNKPAWLPCPALYELENGQFNSSADIEEHPPGTIVTYRCDEGFYIDSLDDDFNFETASRSVYTIYCERSGRWNMEEPACEDLVCEAQNAPDHGTVTPSGDVKFLYDAGDELVFSCDEGYTLQGETRRVCSIKHGGWSGPREPAKCINIACPRINELPNGQIYGNRYRLGDTISFECDAGFTLIGPSNRTCLETFQWSGTFTTCENDDWYCPDPGVPVGGSRTGNRYFVGATLEFECDPGYIMRGNSTRECLFSGRWSGLEVTCRSAHAYDPPDVIIQTFRPAFDRLKYYTTSSTVNDTNRYSSLFNDTDTRRRRRRHSLKTLTHRLHKRAIEEGSVQGLDLYFLFDASGSISQEDFQASIQFAMRLVREVGISNVEDPSGTRIGIVTFNDNANIKLYPNDRGVTTVDHVLAKLLEIKDETGGGTCMSCGLRSLHRVVIPTARRNMPGRQRSKTVAMLLSDGRHNTGGHPSLESDILKSKQFQAEIFTIGVTNDVDSEVLDQIASEAKNEHVFLFQKYADLGTLISLLTSGTEDYSGCGKAWEPMGPRRGRVIGGTDAREGKWRWQAGLYFGSGGKSLREKIQKRYALQCGGSVIDRQWVLTAAHCFRSGGLDRATPDSVYVKLGVSNLEKEESLVRQIQYMDVDAIYLHKDYSSLTYENDIALVHLSKPIVYDLYVGRVCLPDLTEYNLNPEKLYTKDGTVTGWGHTEPRKSKMPSTMTGRLQEVKLPIIDDENCRESLDSIDDFRPGMFCAGSGQPEGEDDVIRDSCRGDSGGPLVRKVLVDTVTREQKWLQLGIVSWGEGCAQRGHHGFYTKLQLFTNWVKAIRRSHDLLGPDSG